MINIFTGNAELAS